MLSRTADHLYWMSRYLERAECLARMLDAHHKLSMLPRPPEAVLQGWTATLVSLGMEQEFLAKHGAVTPRAAFDFIAFDREHFGSIAACLRAARTRLEFIAPNKRLAALSAAGSFVSRAIF